MALRIKDADGILRTVSRLAVKAGGLRQFRTLKFMDENEDVQLVAVFAPPLSLSISPGDITGEADISTNVAVSPATTATPSGGLPPYTYAWTHVSWTTLNLSAPTNATTVFSLTMTPGQVIIAVYRCTVTDAALSTATSTITIEFEHPGT